jgi:hypothetical protein
MAEDEKPDDYLMDIDTVLHFMQLMVGLLQDERDRRMLELQPLESAE